MLRLRHRQPLQDVVLLPGKEEGEWLIRERRSSSFARHFTLPNDIDAEAVTAEVKNGVLTVIIPRKAETKPRSIAITAK